MRLPPALDSPPISAPAPPHNANAAMVLSMDHSMPPADPSAPPTMHQDQAVIGWIATRPNVPAPTRELLIDVLIVWEFFAPLPAVTALPSDGTDVDIGDVLRQIDRRLLVHPSHPDDLQAQMTLADLHHLLGLARYSLLDPDGARAGRARNEQHLAKIMPSRVLQTDAAVDLALADLRRERGT